MGHARIRIALVLVALLVGWSFGSSRARSSGASGAGSDGTVIQANGGQWTNIAPKKLTSMLKHEDFTLFNVRTPYVGEMAGTDLCIPYPNITAHASELPTDKIAKIVVYCWTGHESAIAAQTLVDLGHTKHRQPRWLDDRLDHERWAARPPLTMMDAGRHTKMTT